MYMIKLYGIEECTIYWSSDMLYCCSSFNDKYSIP